MNRAVSSTSYDSPEGKITHRRVAQLHRCALLFVVTVLVGWLATACAPRTSGSSLYPQLVAHTGKEVGAVRFIGTAPYSSDTLSHMVETKPTSCVILGIPTCAVFRLGRQVYKLDPEAIRRDVQKLTLFYRAEGYFGTRVEPVVEARGPDEVTVTFAIQRGESIILDALEVTGTEGIINPDSLARTLPLKPGQIFNLGKFSQSADAVMRAMHTRGHAYAEILRNFTVDTIDNRAVASLQAIPGPRVVVDSIIVSGAEHLGRANAIRQLSFRVGDVLQVDELASSQRNLYSLDLVRIASVAVAPDSMQKPPPNDSTTATVAVSLAEAPVHQVDAAIGFGTTECLRTEASWLNRSLGGGARTLAFTGSVSRIGVGGGTESGLGRYICKQESTFKSKIDYRISAEFTQPYFLSPRNQLAFNLFEERQSEPGVYQREVRGGRATLAHRLGNRSYLTGAFDVERGSTIASPALYCQAFLVCQIGFTDSLARARFRDELDVTFTHDRTDNPLDPANGFNVSSTASWAPKWLGSEITFFRWSGQGAYYRELVPSWVMAVGGRFGNFFRSATLDPAHNFLPPQERFFAGGANSVRGFDRNALGQGAYVTTSVKEDEDGDTIPDIPAKFIPTGGTSLVVGSAELRFPSPVLSHFMRLAVFVDAGAVGTESLWDLSTHDIRFTPGAGLRLTTPVGPVRIDVAYNPYGPPAGPLLLSENTDSPTGTLRRVADAYQPGAGTIFNRFHITLGIGQAY